MAALAEEMQFANKLDQNQQPSSLTSAATAQQPKKKKTKLKVRSKSNPVMDASFLLRVFVVVYRYFVMFYDMIIFLYLAGYEFVWSFFGFFLTPKDKMNLHGKISIVTGAGQGIGRELAFKLAREGARVICVDKIEETNVETANKIREEIKGIAHSFTCDVTKRDQIDDLHTRIVNDGIGDPTILINNAGVLYCRPFLQHSSGQIENVMQTNLMGQMWMMQKFLPAMITLNEGSIVSMCSIAGHMGTPYMVPYSASKHGVKGMVEALHQELRYSHPDNKIHLMNVSPFIIDTGMVKGASIRFPNLINIVSAVECAETIVSQLKKEADIVFIPRRYYYLHNFCRLFPTRVQYLIMDFLDSGININYDNDDEL